MKIFVAIPVYDGKILGQVVTNLFLEQAEAIKNGDELHLFIGYGSAGIAQSRNLCVTNFMKSDCDKLMFVDNDITWEPGDLIKLCKMPVDFVGGAYRLKRIGERYPVAFLPHDPKGFKGIQLTENTALIEVEGLPTGFLSLSRKVFEKMMVAHPERTTEIKDGEREYCFFHMPFVDGHLYGEDLYFCRTWLEMGEKIYLYPDLNLIHWSSQPTPHYGNMGKWLKDRDKPQIDFQDEINKLAANMEKHKNTKPSEVRA